MNDDIMLERLYDRMIQNLQAYHPAAKNSKTIRRAFETAKAAHTGQVRKSGEPFIIHPLEVAIILSEMRLDKETIIAALLHDVVEDTLLTTDDIKNEFGEEVMFLVDGVTKLSRMSNSVSKAEMKLESFRKLIMAAATDIRVIIIKLADRLHNMRTLQFRKKICTSPCIRHWCQRAADALKCRLRQGKWTPSQNLGYWPIGNMGRVILMRKKSAKGR